MVGQVDPHRALGAGEHDIAGDKSRVEQAVHPRSRALHPAQFGGRLEHGRAKAAKDHFHFGHGRHDFGASGRLY